MSFENRLLAFSAGLLLVSLGWATPAQASHTISTCQATCEVDCDDPGSGPNCHEAEGGECLVATDLTCSSTTQPAIVLEDGMDLDLDDHYITCASGVNCSDGIDITSSGSKVYNGSSGEAGVLGKFFYGVDCNLHGNSQVLGIRIEDSLVGVKDCKTVKQNVIVGLGRTYLTVNWGIQTAGVTNTGDLISENYFADKSRAVFVAGDKKVEVNDNIIHTTGWGACAVELASSTSEAIAKRNTILGVGNAGFGSTREIFCLPATEPTGINLFGNVCNRDHPDCAACGTAGFCEEFVAPFLP